MSFGVTRKYTELLKQSKSSELFVTLKHNGKLLKLYLRIYKLIRNKKSSNYNYRGIVWELEADKNRCRLVFVTTWEIKDLSQTI